MKLLQELLEALDGAARKAMALGRSTALGGKPMAKREVIEKNIGADAWEHYVNGFKDGEKIAKSRDPAGEERRAKIAAKTGVQPPVERRKGMK